MNRHISMKSKVSYRVKSNVRYIVILLISIIVFKVNAQTLKIDEDVWHWEGGFNIGLNNDGYEFDFRGLYFPIQYVGAKIGIGAAGEIKEMGDWGSDQWETGHVYAVRFKFNPAIALRTPRLIHWKSQDGGFYLFTEPGIVLSPGASGSKNAEYFRWDVKSGINLQIDRYIVTLGYGISNFSLYSGEPINHNGIGTKTNYITHSVFIGGAYKF